jgi:maltooligosyltrehalose trehalohydrolase
MDPFAFDLGAVYEPPDTGHFRVWAPHAKQVWLSLKGSSERQVPMQRQDHDYHTASVDNVRPGSRYSFKLDNQRERPDPASRHQPEGVHAPSEVVNLSFDWHDWKGLSLSELVIYELHIGTFTPEGTFDSAIGQLDRLRDLGVTAIEVMPVAQFPGNRNWGYDGVSLFAVQNSYGGPWAFQRFIDAAHRRGLAVLLDVVYNHLGPEGNYLREFGPYFTDRYRVPWGEAVNFDGAGSDEVKRFFICNALYWQTHFRLDGLRLDAVPCIKDSTARHVLAELAHWVGVQARKLGRPFHLIAESDLNDPRLTTPEVEGGIGLSATWNDDFHHAVHSLLTGERTGYYADFGDLESLARACKEGFAYAGHFSRYRGRRHGASAASQPHERFVVCIQNHDQVGNRARGDRLGALVDFESLKLAAGLMLLSPYIPMLFMGEEYAESAPFQYFTSHGDRRLAEAVSRGRRQEFAAFAWQGEVPDPQDEATFRRSKLHIEESHHGRGAVLHDFYKELLSLRKSHPALARLCNRNLEVRTDENAGTLFIRRWADPQEGAQGPKELIAIYQVADRPHADRWPVRPGRWHRLLASAAGRWQGPGGEPPEILDVPLGENPAIEIALPSRSFVVYARDGGS